MLNYYRLLIKIQSSNSNQNINKVFISDPNISQVHNTAAVYSFP